jgi:hypothetical protein
VVNTLSGHGIPPPAGVRSAAARLAREAAAAAELRGWQTHPDVVALRVEQIRTQVDRLMWAGIVLGLCFTMANVQHFAAVGTRVGSLAWCSAWLMDPMVSLVLLAVLRAEQVTTRYQVSTGNWPRVAKWALLLATYLMNTWTSWAAGSASGVVLHSVPPLVVVIAAEAITDVQHALTECVQRAHAVALQRTERTLALQGAGCTTPTDQHLATQHSSGAVKTGLAPPQAVPDEGSPAACGERPASPRGECPAGGPGGHPVNETGERAVGAGGERGAPHPVNPPARDTKRTRRADGQRRRTPRASRANAPKGRKLLADYVAEARSAWTPGVVVIPAWVRQVTACSRGLSSKVAAALNADPPTPLPDQSPQARSEPEGSAA